ncbi:MAG TPA: hypothetical protein PKD90_00755 [Phnomibacter sp.]|nr:hypothetical protein [Phnomibacter sp.]
MARTWNIDFDIPAKVPLPMYYEHLIMALDEPVIYVKFGELTIDFCNEDMANCSLKEYCHCLKYQ